MEVNISEDTSMKAIRIHQFGGPEVLKYEDLLDPIPGPGQVVVKVRAIGINPFETYMREGKYAIKPPLPFTPGVDVGGVIEAVGDGVKEFKVGDRVYTAGTVSGAYAEKALCEVKTVHPLPERISFAQGAAIGVPYATAYRALFLRGQARAGETVLIHGATGGVGLAAVQLTRARGLTVFGTGGTDKGRELVQREGAHHVFDHHAPDYLRQIMDATGGEGVNLIIEMLANENLAKDLSLLSRNGRVVVVGSRGKIEIDPRETMGRDADIRGMTINNASDGERRAIHMALNAGLENGALRPIIGEEFPLAEAARAQVRIMEGSSQGKIVLMP